MQCPNEQRASPGLARQGDGVDDLVAKNLVMTAGMKALQAVTELIELYWSIGRSTLKREEVGNWGNGVMGRWQNNRRQRGSVFNHETTQFDHR